MKVKFWGVRGSIAAPINTSKIQEKIKKVLSIVSTKDIQSEDSIQSFLKKLPFSYWGTYGSNTTCLEIRDKNNELIIVDGGTGLRELGNSILQEGFLTGKGKANWVITHTHWDHIQGIPFFVPIYIDQNEFLFISCLENLEERLRYQHVFSHFPVLYEQLRAKKYYKLIRENESVPITKYIQATPKMVRHPGGNYAYKFEEDGKSIIFASDAEFTLDEFENIAEYINFFKNADVLIFDTQYTFADSLQKIDWGHSSASIATDIALKANVKKLVMFHHDPSYDDDKLDSVYVRALEYKDMIDPDNHLEIIMAYEGLELEV